MRTKWPVFLLFAPFAACILGAYAWFNVGVTNSELPSPNSYPHLWLSVRTNIPGYIFIEEPVSDEVKESGGRIWGLRLLHQGLVAKLGA